MNEVTNTESGHAPRPQPPAPRQQRPLSSVCAPPAPEQLAERHRAPPYTCSLGKGQANLSLRNKVQEKTF